MKNKHAIVTGASRGIGRAIAEGLARSGYDLTITCINNEEMLNELAAELREAYKITCRTFTGDLSDPSQADRLFEGVEKLDVLVNNAGISYVGLIQDMTPEEWNRVIGVNLSSAFYCSRLAVPLMLKKKDGCIINISSVWGERGASTEVAYSASKGGLNAFTRALARELAPSNIRVNAIACGMIDTDMNRIFDADDISSIIEEIPAGRMGRPDEVADLVCSLCLGNSYITGQVITLDGGWM
ncbi:MAG: 3-oxoacyl-ACP reductase FabG [Lachnospiraceae bacterium]|nr:3-oxoacyl-ACP reductase FabG [Lachnospiraceae bacterium]